MADQSSGYPPDGAESPSPLRCFLGFELAPESRAWLEGRVEALRAGLEEVWGWSPRVIRPDNWHATLLFFHGLDEWERGRVWEQVRGWAAQGTWAGLKFNWKGWALWPSPRRANLLCLEAAAHQGAGGWPIQQALGEEPFRKGITRHLGTYVPHITLMRFHRRGHRVTTGMWEDARNKLPLLEPVELEMLRFDRVSFFLSTLSAHVPVYPREYTAAL